MWENEVFENILIYQFSLQFLHLDTDTDTDTDPATKMNTDPYESGSATITAPNKILIAVV